MNRHARTSEFKKLINGLTVSCSSADSSVNDEGRIQKCILWLSHQGQIRLTSFSPPQVMSVFPSISAQNWSVKRCRLKDGVQQSAKTTQSISDWILLLTCFVSRGKYQWPMIDSLPLHKSSPLLSRKCRRLESIVLKLSLRASQYR